MTLNLDFIKKIKLLNFKSKVGGFGLTLYSPSLSVFYEYGKHGIKAVAAPAKNSSIISSVQLEDTVSETVEMSAVLDGSDLYDSIELKLFDELALEPSFEHKICYNEIPSDDATGMMKKYNAYVATHHAIKQRIAPIADSYVDFVFLPQTVIKTLFTKNFISDTATFAFIYLYNDSAYLCVYQNGVLTYSKSIRVSIRVLTERFSEILGERVDLDGFVKMLITSDARSKKPEYETGFKTLLTEFFTSISDVLVHAKRINQISGYEAIYIGTEYGNIADISAIAKEYFETPFRDFDFNLGLKTDGFVDMASKLIIFAFLNDIESYKNLNFSIFVRPPSLFKRPAGKFMTISTAAIVVGFAYPVYNFTIAKVYATYKINSINKEMAPFVQEKDALMARQNNAQKNADSVLKSLRAEEKKYNDTILLLKEIDAAKSDVAGAAGHLIKVADATSRSNVRIAGVMLSSDAQRVEIDKLENKNKELSDKKTTTQSYIDILTKEAAELTKLAASQQNPNDKNDTNSKLQIVNNQLKAKQSEMPKINSDLQTAQLQLKIDKDRQAKQSTNIKSIILRLLCVSKKPIDITDFSKKLSKVDNYTVTVDKIYKEGNSTAYFGEITATKAQQ